MSRSQGSGTQIIAAERTGRVCYAVEQEPAYVDVAVARWEAFTGQKATRETGTVDSSANSEKPCTASAPVTA